jgi:hypothetical protein
MIFIRSSSWAVRNASSDLSRRWAKTSVSMEASRNAGRLARAVSESDYAPGTETFAISM